MTSISSGKNAITFKSGNNILSGNLYTPEGFDASKQYPTIVFTPPFNQVKEQMGALYGRKMAEKGFVMLAFDHTGYGESEGEIRNYENAFIKIEDVHNAISYLRTLPFVDREKFYGIGACAGGGYMALAAVTDKRMKAVATVCGMLDNRSTFLAGADRDTAVVMFSAANDARQEQYETGEPTYVDQLGYEGVKREELPEGARREGFDYYMTARAGVETYPRYSNRSLPNIAETNALTDATTWAQYLYTPYLGIYGEKALADTGPLTVGFYEKCSEPRELFEVPGASHVDLYDVEKYVNPAVDRLAAFFGKY
ncbi:alpha/beta hydrolase [Agarilytica rhodophyticola]|uniref:alpha/beta hydrolase n=1 Tax=Agarilytica rhodophyticola TaxID=1737490 RepID=UPI000B34575F|nr:alpha/beta hydrolase [Agarilytica rhodophyticola]